jgi:hypothetical protein|tara:strand:+ start:10545 stop:10700 length:156 start_codon:yes stop_codon:yes gene_type:complete
MAREVFRPAPPPEGPESGPLWRKLAWFGALMLAGLVSVALAAYVLRAALFL